MSRAVKKLIACICVALTVLAVGGSASSSHDDLPSDQDNGDQGRDNGLNEGHLAPIEACKDTVDPSTGSRILRVLPRGPLADDGSLAFQSGVCVYLPPGYDSGEQRYPVLYLLHGGGGDQADWVTFGGVRSIMDVYAANDPRDGAIVVMPDGNNGLWHDSHPSYDEANQPYKVETYVRDYVIPYIDDHFRTIADRRGRVITGLSNGGYGSLLFAAKAPDTFVAAGSMSGNVGGRSFDGLGSPVVPGGPRFQEAGSYYYGNVPIELAPNLDDVDLVINWGSTCSSDLTADACGSWAFEQLFRGDNQALRDRLNNVGHRGKLVYSEDEGGHAWRWWPKWLREKHLPVLLAAAADPEPADQPPLRSDAPASFRYRTIAPSFEIYGYEVAVSRSAAEFSDLRDVTPAGFEIQGSGSATVSTPPIYRPNGKYLVTGTGGVPEEVRASKDGRLRIVVDLGPAHEADQYSPQARAMQAAGPYWVVRHVTIATRGRPSL